MKVRELIAALADVDQEAEVRLAFQPSYPQEYSVDRNGAYEVAVPGEGIVVYIAEGLQIGGLPRAAREELGW